MRIITPTQYWKAVKKHNRYCVKWLINAVARGDDARAEEWASRVVECGYGVVKNRVPEKYLPFSNSSLNIKE